MLRSNRDVNDDLLLSFYRHLTLEQQWLLCAEMCGANCYARSIQQLQVDLLTIRPTIWWVCKRRIITHLCWHSKLMKVQHCQKIIQFMVDTGYSRFDISKARPLAPLTVTAAVDKVARTIGQVADGCSKDE